MKHAPPEAVPEHRLPTAQSQGFANVLVVPFSDPYSTGPLSAATELPPQDLSTFTHDLPHVPHTVCTDPAVG